MGMMAIDEWCVTKNTSITTHQSPPSIPPRYTFLMPDQPATTQATTRATDVDADTMRASTKESKTPFKYGVILRHPEKDGLVDCPSSSGSTTAGT
jgi:hypothetical protein